MHPALSSREGATAPHAQGRPSIRARDRHEDQVNGVPQKPLEGVTTVYTLDDIEGAAAPSISRYSGTARSTTMCVIRGHNTELSPHRTLTRKKSRRNGWSGKRTR